MRCARCTREWTPLAASPAPEPEPEAQPAPEPVAEPRPAISEPRPSAMDRLAAQPAAPRSSVRLKLAWATSVLVLLLAVGAAFVWRTEIVASWPPSARAYALFGLEPRAEAAQ